MQWIEQTADAGVQLYTFHIEPCKNVPDVCRKIREAGMQVSKLHFYNLIRYYTISIIIFIFTYFLQVGVGIKPNTSVSAVAEYIDMADVVLIMTVEPGFGGQKFMSDMMTKVQWLRSNYPSLDIEVDGGVGLDTIHQCAEVNEIYQSCLLLRSLLIFL